MGAYLHSARRGRKLSIERAAEDTKIRPDFLMRMESDEFDFLAPAYVRGFLKTYAGYLGVDPEPLLEEFETRYAANRVDPTQLLVKDRSKAPKDHNPKSRWILSAIGAGVIIVVLALIGLAQGRGDSPPSAAPTASPSPSITPGPTPTPSVSNTPKPSPTEDGTIALADDFKVMISAERGDCWIIVTVGDENIYGETLVMGTSQSFERVEGMTISFASAERVDLYINGRNFGAPGSGELTLHIPEDLDSL